MLCLTQGLSKYSLILKTLNYLKIYLFLGLILETFLHPSRSFKIYLFRSRSLKINLFPCALQEINLFGQSMVRISLFARGQERKKFIKLIQRRGQYNSLCLSEQVAMFCVVLCTAPQCDLVA